MKILYKYTDSDKYRNRLTKDTPYLILMADLICGEYVVRTKEYLYNESL